MQGEFDAALAALVRGLPSAVSDLLDSPAVSILHASDPEVPEWIAKEFAAAARDRFSAGMPSCCCHDEEAGTVLVVAGRIEEVPHELIHVAQAFASPEALEESFRAVAADGERLAQAARARVREGADAKEHRDLKWCRAATQWMDSDPTRRMVNFDLHVQIHPVPRTLELGLSLGLPTREAVNAATYAYYLLCDGLDDFGCDLAKEVVAYRHESDLTPLVSLFEDSLSNAPSEPIALRA